DALEAAGLAGSRQELRAAALEALADPTHAATLLTGTPTHPGDNPDPETGKDPGDGPASGSGRCELDLSGAGTRTIRGTGGRDAAVRPVGSVGSPWRIGTLTLDLHLTLADLITGAGGHSHQLGELARSQIHHLVSRADKVVITPVLDPYAPDGVEGYQIPDRIARAVKLRNPTVAFPYSNRSSTSTHVQCDHVIPYPEGPTHTDNLAPESPKAHRAKTFGGYRTTTIRPGTYHWTTPTGQQFWVTPHGTYHDNPDTTPPPAFIHLADRARQALLNPDPRPPWDGKHLPQPWPEMDPNAPPPF
ncbi:MAG TPA: HNH endonuclease, partial [Propionibacterium sp.]|nr:HNH endonuclease [Propionibacterium sp.]